MTVAFAAGYAVFPADDLFQGWIVKASLSFCGNEFRHRRSGLFGQTRAIGADAFELRLLFRIQ
jgi:hypothetical protein